MSTAQTQMGMFQDDLLNSILGQVLPSGEQVPDKPGDEAKPVETTDEKESE